ncbi:hypothetical protein [Maricaulis sp.]|uniref:hypothetical protein n=1 Tax=Maricaulis sp. TaxID=1486257 RepID=UPI003A8DC2DE
MGLLQDMLSALDRWDEWKRMRATPDRVDELERRLKAVESRLTRAPGDPSLPLCPICRSGRLKTIDIKPDPQFAFAGLQIHTLKCDDEACGHSETRQVDPKKS